MEGISQSYTAIHYAQTVTAAPVSSLAAIPSNQRLTMVNQQCSAILSRMFATHHASVHCVTSPAMLLFLFTSRTLYYMSSLITLVRISFQILLPRDRVEDNSLSHILRSSKLPLNTTFKLSATFVMTASVHHRMIMDTAATWDS